MDANQAAERFVELFHGIFLRYHERRDPGERELSLEALGVLHHLSRTGPLTVTEAARHFERSQAAMSEIFARLERRELVVRYPDERDRRRTLVWMSQAGVEAWRRSRRVLDPSRLERAFAELDAAERGDALRALERLLAKTPPTPFEDECDD